MNESGAPREPYLVLCGGLICIVMAAVFVGAIVASSGWLPLAESPLAVVAAAPEAESSGEPGDRTDCGRFGSSDLRSPQEGLWFQANCTGVPDSPAAGNEATCNRTALDPAEFRLIAPGLYVFQQTTASRAYVWYASGEGCFNLVSARVVTVVCADQTVSFSWGKGVCSERGGVLARVNGG
jgi:hypothetical protein